MENKPASLLVESLGKEPNGMPPSLCGKQVMGPSNPPLWWPSLTKDMQTELELIRMNEQMRPWRSYAEIRSANRCTSVAELFRRCFRLKRIVPKYVASYFRAAGADRELEFHLRSVFTDAALVVT